MEEGVEAAVPEEIEGDRITSPTNELTIQLKYRPSLVIVKLI
jgi:hypothetical protein